jgi:hypothetical protein
MAGRKMTAFHQIAREKGWTLVEIGQRWGVSERQMSRVANNPSHKDLDAVRGLPAKNT